MFEEASLAEQYARTAGDRVRVLVVGAGVAGVTAAQLLRADGLHPVLIERSADAAGGYMLALMPMVDRALDDLGVHDAYRDASRPFGYYRMRSHRGIVIRTDAMSGLLARFGDYRGISRDELLRVLASRGCPVTTGATVASLTPTPEGPVTARLESAAAEATLDFDAVIVADGLHSRTRVAVTGDEPVAGLETGWGGWVVWIDADDEMDTGEELWGAGFFLGTYPVAGRLGAFLGGPDDETRRGRDEFVASVRARLATTSPRIERTLAAVLDADDPYYWPMVDRRAERWVRGHIALVGDAGAGFLPTAGIGAGMAMESAWVLARILHHAEAGTVPDLLAAYERAQRPRVEAAQANSRSLARLMFRPSRALAVLRELLARTLSVSSVLGPIRKLLETPVDPDEIAAQASRVRALHGRAR